MTYGAVLALIEAALTGFEDGLSRDTHTYDNPYEQQAYVTGRIKGERARNGILMMIHDSTTKFRID